MGAVGVMGLRVPGMSWREIREAAVLAEDLGYSCITMGESWGEDALTSLAQLAAVTSRIRIGTSIVPVFARSPAPPATPRTHPARGPRRGWVLFPPARGPRGGVGDGVLPGREVRQAAHP